MNRKDTKNTKASGHIVVEYFFIRINKNTPTLKKRAGASLIKEAVLFLIQLVLLSLVLFLLIQDKITTIIMLAIVIRSK